MPLSLKLGRIQWSATWPMTLLTIAAVVLFVDLGRWQWGKAQHAQAQLASFLAGNGTPGNLDTTHASALARYAGVQAHGHYDAQHQFLLDNMSHDGQPGYQVLTPLQLQDGRSVLVNRGWVPITASRAQLPDVALSEPDAVSVSGRLDDLPVPGISLGHVAPLRDAPWPKMTSFPTMADLAAVLGYALEPRQLLLGADQPHGYVRDWHPGGFGPERYLSYAVQWWGFAALALFLYGYLNRRKRR